VKLPLYLTLVLFGVWLLWSGHTEPLLISLGVVSTVSVVAVCRRMGLIDEGRILDPRLPIRPELIRVKAGQRDDLGRTIYANSITLTPGTVSVGVEGDEIVVHALTREAAEGLQTGEMDRRVTAFEGRG
jgi:multicomponent Na+:H+ antiporter subunit E